MATGQNIADEARADLNDGDASNYRWSDAHILLYINAALRQILLILPEANVIEESFTLAVGSRQTIPTGGTKFLGAYNLVVAISPTPATNTLGVFTPSAGGDGTSTFEIEIDDGNGNVVTITVTGDVTAATLAAAFVSAGWSSDGSGEVEGYTLDLGAETTIEDAIDAGSLVIVREDGVDFTYTETVGGATYDETVPTFASAEDPTTDGDPGEEIRGRAITQVEEDALDTAYPTWASEVLAPDEADDFVVQHVTHDPRDPTHFSIYPGAPEVPEDMHEIFLKYAKIPTALTTLADTFPLRAEFLNGAIEYVKYRMLMKDGRYGSEPQLKQDMWNNFLRALGIKVQSDRRVDPAVMRPPADEHG